MGHWMLIMMQIFILCIMSFFQGLISHCHILKLHGIIIRYQQKKICHQCNYYVAYSQGSHLFDENIDPALYGIDYDLPDSIEDDDVVVPEVHLPLSDASIQELHGINSLEECDDFGKQLYLAVIV